MPVRTRRSQAPNKSESDQDVTNNRDAKSDVKYDKRNKTAESKAAGEHIVQVFLYCITIVG